MILIKLKKKCYTKRKADNSQRSTLCFRCRRWAVPKAALSGPSASWIVCCLHILCGCSCHSTKTLLSTSCSESLSGWVQTHRDITTYSLLQATRGKVRMKLLLGTYREGNTKVVMHPKLLTGVCHIPVTLWNILSPQLHSITWENISRVRGIVHQNWNFTHFVITPTSVEARVTISAPHSAGP